MNHELLMKSLLVLTKLIQSQFYVPVYNPVIYFMLCSNAAKRRGCFLMLIIKQRCGLLLSTAWKQPCV